MKNFKNSEMEIILFGTDDIMTTSYGNTDATGTGGDTPGYQSGGGLPNAQNNN